MKGLHDRLQENHDKFRRGCVDRVIILLIHEAADEAGDAVLYTIDAILYTALCDTGARVLTLEVHSEGGRIGSKRCMGHGGNLNRAELIIRLRIVAPLAQNIEKSLAAQKQHIESFVIHSYRMFL